MKVIPPLFNIILDSLDWRRWLRDPIVIWFLRVSSQLFYHSCKAGQHIFKMSDCRTMQLQLCELYILEWQTFPVRLKEHIENNRNISQIQMMTQFPSQCLTNDSFEQLILIICKLFWQQAISTFTDKMSSICAKNVSLRGCNLRRTELQEDGTLRECF